MSFPRRAAPLLLACLVALPLVGADGFGGTAPFGLDAPHVPQAYCVIVQNKPVPAEDPERCDVLDAAVRGVHLLRVRVWGEGHAFVWVDEHIGYKTYRQHGPLDCRADLTAPSWPSLAGLDPSAPAAKTCALVLAGGDGLSATVNLHVFTDGPGRAAYAVDLERVAASLP